MAKKRTLKRRSDANKPASKSRTLKRKSVDNSPAPAPKSAPKKSLPKSLNKSTKSTPKLQAKTPPPAPPVSINVPKSERVYTVRQLRGKERTEFAKFFKDIDTINAINTLKKPDELWAAEIPWTVKNKVSGVTTRGISRTLNTYTNATALFARISGYKANLERKGVSKAKSDKWLDTIKIVKLKGSITDQGYARTRQRLDNQTREIITPKGRRK